MRFIVAALAAALTAAPAAAQPPPMGAAARYEAAFTSVQHDVAMAGLLHLCGVRSQRWADTIRHAGWLMLGQYYAELRREARDPAAFDRQANAPHATVTETPPAEYENCRRAVAHDLHLLDNIYDAVRYR